MPSRPGLLERLGLHRPELRAWTLYDWANSVFMTTVLQVFPIYFATVASSDVSAAEANQRYYVATTAAVVLMALIAPLLGAVADERGLKKPMMGGFMLLGVLATGLLATVGRGDWRLGAFLYVVANVGVAGSIVFYGSLLPHVARPDEVDRVSTAGFAVGYLGGGALLAVNMYWMRHPHAVGAIDTAGAVRMSFLSAAVWWLAFSIPLFRTVKEPAARPREGGPLTGHVVSVAFQRLVETFHAVRGYRDAFLLLVAFMIYNDGVVTIIHLATAFGTEVGIKASSLLLAVLVVQFAGVPFSFAFGSLATRIGARPAVLIGLGVYGVITVVGYRMHTATQFFVLAFLVATVQGGVQALSRSMFASMVPRSRSSEFFGFFGVFERFSGVLGPLLFTGSVASTGSSRAGILGLILFFVAGGTLLMKVDVARGQAFARAAEGA